MFKLKKGIPQTGDSHISLIHPPKESDCVKSPLRCHPRPLGKSGDPYPANINWILAESSLRPAFVGMTKPEDCFLHSLSSSNLPEKKGDAKFFLSESKHPVMD